MRLKIYHRYENSKNNLHMNDTNTDTHNQYSEQRRKLVVHTL
jgi:hypothetical protein